MSTSTAVTKATCGAVILTILLAVASIAGFQIALGLAIIGTLAAAATGVRRPARTGLELPILVFMAWSAAMIPLSADPSLSLKYFGRFYLYLGLWTCATWVTGPRMWRGALIAFVAGSAIYFVISMVEHLAVGTSHRMYTAHGAMTGGGLAMISLLVTAPFALSASVGGRQRVLAWTCLLIFGTALVMTVTRSAILGTACGLLVLMIGLRSRLLMAAALLLVVAGAAFFLLLGDHPSAARFAPGEILEGKNTVSRIDAWKTGLEVLREEPLTGRGDADMKALLMERRRVDVEYDFGHVHNNMIQIGANWGLPGLAMCLWLFIGVFAALGRRWRRFRDHAAHPLRGLWALGAIAAWVGFHVAGLFEWYFGDAEVMSTLFVITGMALAAFDGSEESQSA